MTKIWERYSPKLAEDKFDAIIIGSGMGGLSTAAFLSKAGKKVLVLERHFKVGGWTHTFQRGKYEWDVGIHYIGAVGRKSAFLRKLFDEVTEERLEWAPMPDNYDRMIFPDKSYNFVAGKDRFIDQMVEYFPNERKAIEKYLDLVKQCTRASAKFFMNRAMPKMISDLTYGPMSRSFLEMSDKTTWDVLSSLTDNQELIGVLTGQFGDYGLTPKQSSFAINAIVANHYLYGGYYPVGGSRMIAENIAPVIQRSGGKIVVNATVDEILIHKNKAVGVKLENGDELMAPLVVSSAGVGITFGKLAKGVASYEKKLEQVEPSCAHVCLYIGMNETAENMGLEATNLWVYPGYDHDANVENYLNDPSKSFPMVYMSFASAKDPTWTEKHGQTATMEAITLAPYEMFSKWEKTSWKKRGDDYDALKDHLTNRLMNYVYANVPQVEGYVDHVELSTPLTTRDFLGYDKGEIYGVNHTPSRFRQKWLRPHTPVKQLYLTGQDIVTDGVGGALMSGVVTSSAILKKNVMKNVVSG